MNYYSFSLYFASLLSMWREITPCTTCEKTVCRKMMIKVLDRYCLLMQRQKLKEDQNTEIVIYHNGNSYASFKEQLKIYTHFSFALQLTITQINPNLYKFIIVHLTGEHHHIAQLHFQEMFLFFHFAFAYVWGIPLTREQIYWQSILWSLVNMP